MWPTRLNQFSQQEGEWRSQWQTQNEEEGHQRAGRLTVFTPHQPERKRQLQLIHMNKHWHEYQEYQAQDNIWDPGKVSSTERQAFILL